MLEPTNRLLNYFNIHGLKGTFFVDIIYYMRLLESEATSGDALMIKNQLQAIVSQGSRIELHLHAHWLDAIYVNGEWQFPTYDKFRLQSLSDQKISELFSVGTQVLEDIARQVSPEYKVIAFRAGGFCIQPFTLLKSGFIANGIIVDSSVAPGKSGNSLTHKFNFEDAPDNSFYHFESDPNVASDLGQFLEIPIATYKKNIKTKIQQKIITRLFPNFFKPIGDGLGMPFPTSWASKLKTSTMMFTLDGEMFPSEMIRNLYSSERNVVTFISHPKSLSLFSFECFERIIFEGFEFIGLDEIANLSGGSASA